MLPLLRVKLVEN